MAAPPPKRVVFVTGFRPFGEHDVNSSWEAVKRLRLLDVEKDFNVRLVIDEVPVEYEYVPDYLQRKWKELNPHLVVHCGVAGQSEAVKLEQCAYCSDYERCDVKGRIPDGCRSRRSVKNDSGCVQSGFDMELVRRRVMAAGVPCAVEVSCDAGRYVCEWTYFHSLCEDPRRTAFIHTTKLSYYSVDDLAQTIKQCIGEFLKLLEDRESNEIPS